MSNTSNTTNIKRGRGRPKKDATIKPSEGSVDHTVGVPVLLEPNIHDIYDELSRMDSFAYSKYNQ